MECFTFLVFGILMIIGAAQVLDWIKDSSLRDQISAAFKKGDYDEYTRLVNLRENRKPKVYPAQDNFPSDLDYLGAMVILNMAEDGYFLPGGHQVFERLDNINHERYDEYEDLSYYDDGDYDEFFDQDSEYSDHWGLG